MEFKIPEYTNIVLDKLEKAGFEAFVVGGSIRDLLLNKRPSDFDVTTNATPDEVIEIFKDYRTILVGKEFGTVVVVQKEGNIEITTYRTEAEYIDGRRPSKVFFSDDITEDLSRRDFTVNAMAYNKSKGLIDPFNGLRDLKDKKIQSVGNPYDRFNEDHLRILRAIRFAGQLQFQIESDTYKACKEMSHLLKTVSGERIQQELYKIVLSKRPSYGINLMKELGALEIIIPEFKDTFGFNQKTPYHDKDVFSHILCVVDNTSNILVLRLAALFHDIAKPKTFFLDEDNIGHFYGHHKEGEKITKEVLTRLKCSKYIIDTVSNLVREHMIDYNKIKDKGLKRLINRIGEDETFYLLDLKKADRLCSRNPKDIQSVLRKKYTVQRIFIEDEAYDKKQLEINGNDIIELGYKQGKQIGEILDFLMEKVLENPSLNKKEILVELVDKNFKRI